MGGLEDVEGIRSEEMQLIQVCDLTHGVLRKPAPGLHNAAPALICLPSHSNQVL